MNSDFVNAAINTFGAGMSIGANAASEARRQRIAQALQQQEQQEQLRREKVAEEARQEVIRRNQFDKARQLYFEASASDNPDHVAAAHKELTNLGKQDASLMLYAEDLGGRLPQIKRKAEAAEAVRKTALETAQKGDAIHLQAMQLGLEADKRQADPVNQEVGQAMRVFENNRNAPGVAASVLTPPQVPMEWEARRGRVMDALMAEQGRVDERLKPETYAQPGGAPATRQDAGTRGRAGAEKKPGKWTYKVDADGNPTRTWEGDEPPPAGEMPQAPVTVVPLPEDRKDYDATKTKLREMSVSFLKLDPKDKEAVQEAQADAAKQANRILDQAKRAIALEPDPEKQRRMTTAALQQHMDLLRPFGGQIAPDQPQPTQVQAQPAQAQPPSPAPMKAQPMPAPTAPLQPVGAAPGVPGLAQAAQLSPEEFEAWKAQRLAEYRAKESARKQANNGQLVADLKSIGSAVPAMGDQLAQALGLKDTPEMEAELKARKGKAADAQAARREALRKKLVAEGMKNPSEALLDELLKAAK